jgi:hypothetical protein
MLVTVLYISIIVKLGLRVVVVGWGHKKKSVESPGIVNSAPTQYTMTNKEEEGYSSSYRRLISGIWTY